MKRYRYRATLTEADKTPKTAKGEFYVEVGGDVNETAWRMAIQELRPKSNQRLYVEFVPIDKYNAVVLFTGLDMVQTFDQEMTTYADTFRDACDNIFAEACGIASDYEMEFKIISLSLETD
jgi:hypothetical protein